MVAAGTFPEKREAAANIPGICPTILYSALEKTAIKIHIIRSSGSAGGFCSAEQNCNK